ncbi:MAG TPA: hypothetical protein VNS81_11025 [Nocardioides sp.]|nr:hypothetical protein [Nocardioides sp.]
MAPPDWDTYSPGRSPGNSPDGTPEGPSPAAPLRPSPPRAPRAPRRPGRRHRWAVLTAIAVAVPVVVVLVIRGATDGGGGLAVLGKHDAQTPEGFADLVDDLHGKVGSTEVFEAVIYPKYAVVDVPLKKGDERQISYYWDGNLSESSKSTSDDVPFDLASIDGAVLGSLCHQARSLVEDPGTCYLIIRRPRADSPDGWLWAYTSNDFSQGGYINYDLRGNEVGRSTW